MQRFNRGKREQIDERREMLADIEARSNYNDYR